MCNTQWVSRLRQAPLAGVRVVKEPDRSGVHVLPAAFLSIRLGLLSGSIELKHCVKRMMFRDIGDIGEASAQARMGLDWPVR